MLSEALGCLQSDVLLGVLKSITGIKDLEIDPHLYGAGLHFHPVNIIFNFLLTPL